ncbi:hypothetical protein C8R43DRAFT_959222 [Mycena crocata]|nr:hypothetical protein C8R43DRAFT_959222 [Mycena crocata]
MIPADLRQKRLLSYQHFMASNIERRVHELLENCGVDAHTMMRGLGLTRSFISGSLPVAALCGLDFQPNDVDVYTPEPEEHRMLEVITQGLAFTMDAEQGTHYPPHLGIRKIYWFSKGEFKLNLMIVKGNNAAVAIFYFHSTVVMNILCYKGLYCFYADLTLARLSIPNSCYLLDPATVRRVMACISKYQARGITFHRKVTEIRDFEEHECHSDPSCPLTIRSMHDNKGAFFAMAAHTGNRVEEEELGAFDDMHSALWCLGGPECGNSAVFQDTLVTSVKLYRKNVSATLQ